MDTEICQPELDPIQYLGMPDLASREPNSADSVNAMRDKILELVRGLDESKAERDSLTKKNGSDGVLLRISGPGAGGNPKPVARIYYIDHFLFYSIISEYYTSIIYVYKYLL